MRFLLRRLGFYLIALWAALTINFLIPRLMPGDPVSIFLAQMRGTIDPRAIDALKLQFGITNDPMYIQYIHYLGELIHGNLGLSTSFYPTPVGDVIRERLPWTIGLIGLSAIISFILGTGIGTLAAWRRGSWFDRTFPVGFTFFQSIPYFWLALIMLYVFAFVWHIFPLSGAYDLYINPSLTPEFVASVIQHGILPALTIVLGSMAGWVLGMRNAMLTTLSEDYVLMAQAKGLDDRRVMVTYAARNAILPNVTGFAMSLGFVVGGALLTELVFSYPGIGFTLLTAVQASDYPLMQGIFLVIAVTVLAANFIADIVTVALDPRTRQER